MGTGEYFEGYYIFRINTHYFISVLNVSGTDVGKISANGANFLNF
jgi:hypothetical protein